MTETTKQGGRMQTGRAFAGYVRVSRQGEREDDRFRSPAFQRETIEAYAARERLILRVFPDEIDVSGARAKRPTLEAILRAIEAGELAGIIVAKLDRLSRLPARERLELFERVESAGGVVLSASESNDVSTPEGRFVRELFLSLARLEWERKADGFAVAKAKAIEQGIAIKVVAPFGYRFDERHGLELVAEDAHVIRALFLMRAEGASYGTCLAHFERMTGRSSHRSTMHGILSNRVYIGELRYGRGVELVNEGAAPRIVSDELFDAVQAVNGARSRASRRHGGRPKSLLAGLARCASCGRGLVRTRTGSKREWSYKCPNDARHCSARAHIQAAPLEAFVVERVLDWAGESADELVELELDARGDRVVAEHRLAEAEARLLEWSEDVELEDREPQAYRTGLAARRRRVELRRSELTALGEATELEIARGSVRDVMTSDEYGTDERRRLLGVVLAGVVVERTPRRGTPVAERAELIFASTGLVGEQDATELVEKAGA